MNERVTVDFDEESYYLDGEYWTSWDHYGEEMAEKINKLLDKQDKIIKNKESLIKAKNEQLDDVKQILKSEMKYACKQKQEYIDDPYVYNAYSIIEHGLIKTLEKLGWD